MRWTPITTIEQLNAVDRASHDRPVLLFKHSTRCSISSAALGRLERAWTKEDDERHDAYYLDLLQHRDVSNTIAERYGVEHESPQVLVVRNGKCTYHTSHLGITYAGAMEALAP
jgi:bacillithiol system protein YtxJ